MTARIFNAAQMNAKDIYGVAGALSRGAVAVFPTDTVYGIGTGAFCQEAVDEIYRIKRRPKTQPLQILTDTVAHAREVGIFSAAARRLARAFWPGALTLIVPPTEKGQALTCGAAGVGIRVPAHPLLLNILHFLPMPLASTSANLHGQPVLTEEKTLAGIFGKKTAIIIRGGTLSPVASSVVDLTQEDNPRLLREGSICREALEHVLKRPFAE